MNAETTVSLSVHVLLLGAVSLLLWRYARYKSKQTDEKIVKSLSMVSALRDTIKENGLQMVIPSYLRAELGPGVTADRIWESHGAQVLLLEYEKWAQLERHVHLDVVEVFFPLSGQIEVDIYDSETSPEPSIKKTLGAEREDVVYLAPGTWHSSRAITEASFLVISRPPVLQEIHR